MGRRNYKIIKHEGTLRDCISDAGEVEDLREEIEEWKSSLEDNSMEHLPKFEELEECAGELEAQDEIETQAEELATALEETPWADLLDKKISYTNMQPYKGRGYPRWMRMSNSLAAMRAALEELGDLTVPEGDEKADEQHTEIESAVQELEATCEQLEGVCFPSMF